MNRTKLRRPLRAAAEHRAALAGAALFALAATVVTVHTVMRANVAGEPELHGQNGLQDFRDAVYYPVRALLDGRNPYDPAQFVPHYPVASAFPLYSPGILSVHAPLGWLPHEVAQLLFYGVHLVLLVVFARLALQLAGGSNRSVFVVAALLLLSRPGHHNAFLGQLTLYAAIGTYMALRFDVSRPAWAAFGFGLTTLKPTYALPLGLLLLCRGAGRSVAAGSAIGAALAFPALIALLRQGGDLRDTLAANLRAFAANDMVDPTTSLYRLDATVPIAHLIGAAPSSAMELLAFLAILAPTAVVVRRSRHRENELDRRGADELICLAMLTAVYHLTYDALLLALPVTALVLGTSGIAGRGAPASRLALLALLSIPMLNYAATESVRSRMALQPDVMAAIACSNACALLAAFAVALVLMSRRGSEPIPALRARSSMAAIGSPRRLSS